MTISSSKNFVRARVDSIKGQYGFISYETDESKKLFFHMSEVEGNTAVEPGKSWHWFAVARAVDVAVLISELIGCSVLRMGLNLVNNRAFE